MGNKKGNDIEGITFLLYSIPFLPLLGEDLLSPVEFRLLQECIKQRLMPRTYRLRKVYKVHYWSTFMT